MAFVGAERMGEPNLPRFKAESAGGGIDAGQRLVGSLIFLRKRGQVKRSAWLMFN